MDAMGDKIARRARDRTDRVVERQADIESKKQTTTIKRSRTTRKTRMLCHPDIKRWYDNLARGSPITADVRIRRLDKFCEMHNMTPIQLADLGMKDVRTATNLLEDHITMMEERQYAPGYIEDHVKAIKSWLGHFDVQITRRLKISNPDFTPTLQDEQVPNAPEITEVFARASLRSSVMISLMAKSGLRPEVIGNHDGTDGLRMRDLPDVIVHQGMAKCTKTPCQVVVRPSLSKARHQYFTFLTASGTRMLLAYLNDRLAHSDSLHGDAPVVAPEYAYRAGRRGSNNTDSKPFLPTRQISKEIRKTFRPRFAWRPYVLRAYFDTELLIAESRGKMAHDFRVFFMGHKGSMEAKYTTNKGILPEMLVREMRESFKRSEDLLDLDVPANDPALEAKQDVQHATSDVMQDAAPEQLGSTEDASLHDRHQQCGRLDLQRQRTIQCGDLDRYLAAGWLFVAVMPDARIIVESASHRKENAATV